MTGTQRIRDRILKQGLVLPRSRVIAAVSGGSDSMALLVILGELRAELDFSLAAAHFDHGIRDDAGRERDLVRRIAGRLGLPLLIGAGNVPGEARARKTGIEETARIMRYAFLDDAAERWGADAVALGHTRDDQVETVLHRIIRGTGWRGLTGMAQRRGRYIRPLLTVSRRELQRLLAERGIRYAADPSNRDNRLMRNRIRNGLIPYLRARYNPSIDDAVLRLSENIAEGWEALSRTIPGFEDAGGGAVEIPLDRFVGAPDFVIYLTIDAVLRDRFGIMQDIEKQHFDAVKRLVRTSHSGRRVELPVGVTVAKQQRTLRLTRGSRAEASPAAPAQVLLPRAGRYPLPGWRCSVAIEKRTGPGVAEAPATRADAEGVQSPATIMTNIGFPVRVRTRRPGDRIVPLGMRGRKKLSDIFIDRKIPLHERDTIPIFEDPDGIIWIPGVTAADRTKIRARTRVAWRFEITLDAHGKIP
jgi:tRNA(Ile)-lysidine synthase